MTDATIENYFKLNSSGFSWAETIEPGATPSNHAMKVTTGQSPVTSASDVDEVRAGGNFLARSAMKAGQANMRQFVKAGFYTAGKRYERQNMDSTPLVSFVKAIEKQWEGNNATRRAAFDDASAALCAEMTQKLSSLGRAVTLTDVDPALLSAMQRAFNAISADAEAVDVFSVWPNACDPTLLIAKEACARDNQTLAMRNKELQDANATMNAAMQSSAATAASCLRHSEDVSAQIKQLATDKFASESDMKAQLTEAGQKCDRDREALKKSADASLAECTAASGGKTTEVVLTALGGIALGLLLGFAACKLTNRKP